YNLPGTTLTNEGRQLFGDLAVYMRDSDYSETEKTIAVVTKPGTVEGRLGCGFTASTYRFRPAEAGVVKAAAHAERPIALTLNGPFQLNALARQDGLDTQIQFAADGKALAAQGLWRLTVTHFGQLQPADQ